MIDVFLVPGYSPDLTFSSPTLDTLRRAMTARDIRLEGVADGWSGHSVRSFGRQAVEHYAHQGYDGILIGHSLGALAALSVIDEIPARHLVLCSPSALFAEDIHRNPNPAVARRIGEQRMQELESLTASDVVLSVNRLGLPTTILFGENERDVYPHIVDRSRALAADIEGARLIEVAGASHSIGENPYAEKLAEVVLDIAFDPSTTPTASVQEDSA